MQIFGLGSQYNTKTILEAELNILKLRQQPYETKKSDYEDQKSIWSSLQTSLTNFNDIVKGLKDLNTDSKDVSFSEEGYVSATATGAAMDASYDVSVKQLATKHRVMSDQLVEGAQGISETVQLNGKDLVLTENMDAKAIAGAINDGSYGVDAVVLNKRLVLTAKDSGSTNEIKFSNSAAWDTLGVTQGGVVKNELQEAKGAIFTINGVQMTSDTNTYNEIDGVSFNFSKVTDSAVEVNVSRSSEKIVDKVTSVVNAYNTIIGNINTLSGEGGSLQGKSIPRTLKSKMNSLLYSVNDSGTMLYQLGISIDGTAKNGTIKLDTSKLTEMYNKDPKKVQNTLTGADGFAGKLYDEVDKYAKTKGLVANEIDGLDTRIDRIQDTLDRYERQFEQQKQSMILKYATFETMMSSLQSQSDYLNAQLGISTSNSN